MKKYIAILTITIGLLSIYGFTSNQNTKDECNCSKTNLCSCTTCECSSCGN